MTLIILILIPLLAGIITLLLRSELIIRSVSLLAVLASLGITISLLFSQTISFNQPWLSVLGINFALVYDGISLLMLLLTALVFVLVILSGIKIKQTREPLMYALILFTQAALTGVFLAGNAFVFYIFWELSLIPVYFLLLLWGGSGRRRITFRFFIYTLSGSLFLLFGIIFLYVHTSGLHQSDFTSFHALQLPVNTQIWLFWILFIGFAIKMPLFPFHTWLPTTYTTAPVQGVIILSAIMTKMGIYGVLRLVLPVVPDGVLFWQNTVIVLALIGGIYASVIAFRQDNLKRLTAFSSMAHISMIIAGLFALNVYALQGAMVLVFSHGMVIAALFYIVEQLKNKTGSQLFAAMGGLRHQIPNFAILMLLVVIASIALPLTSNFAGEFLVIAGLFRYSVWLAAFAGLAMILGAVYMLYAYQQAMLGESQVSQSLNDAGFTDYLVLVPVILIVFITGIFPQIIFNVVNSGFASLLVH